MKRSNYPKNKFTYLLKKNESHGEKNNMEYYWLVAVVNITRNYSNSWQKKRIKLILAKPCFVTNLKTQQVSASKGSISPTLFKDMVLQQTYRRE
jgi:hypothetical protein